MSDIRKERLYLRRTRLATISLVVAALAAMACTSAVAETVTKEKVGAAIPRLEELANKAIASGGVPGLGVILFGSSFFFALLTLPVEFNASARAKKLLVSHGILRGRDEITSVDKVLDAAAWTYVAAAVSAVGVWLFYVFVLLFRGRAGEARR